MAAVRASAGQGVESTLPLPEWANDDERWLGFFLVGAYQEILGDLHNLFGDTDSVDAALGADGEWVPNYYGGNENLDAIDFLRKTNEATYSHAAGTITVADDFTASSASATMQVASVDTGSADRDGHLKSADFFDAENYPTVSFVSTGIKDVKGEEFTLVGDLTIKDVTRQVELAAEYEGTAQDPFGNIRAGFTARTDVDREDFGLTWNAALESGGVLVGKDVTITLDLQGALQQD